MKTKIENGKNKNIGVDVIVLFILTLIFISLISYYFYSKSTRNKISSLSSEKKIITPSPLPTPRPIPHGKKKFTVGQGDHSIPQFGGGEIDPYDPASGAEQTLTISVSHTLPVNRVTVTVKTDNGDSQPYPLTLVSGTNSKGQWKGSWKMKDSYLYTYALILEAKSSDSSASVQVTLR